MTINITSSTGIIRGENGGGGAPQTNLPTHIDTSPRPLVHVPSSEPAK